MFFLFTIKSFMTTIRREAFIVLFGN